MVRALKEAMRRLLVAREKARDKFAEFAFEIDRAFKGDKYHATPDELRGIDRGLKAARERRFATDQEVEAAFVKRRRT